MPTVVAGPSKRAQPHAEVHEDAILRAITPGVRAGLDEIGDGAVAFLLDILSVPVEYDGNKVIRSIPGESPRMETDALRQSTDSNIIEGGELPMLRVSVGPRPGGPIDVAQTLEYEMNRPFMSKALLHIESVAQELMESGLRRTLPK
jgi:hypothetical protein